MKRDDKKPRILFLDIETSHIEARVFSLYPNYIDHGDITRDWKIFSVAWKFSDQKKVYAAKMDRNGCDKAVVEQISKAIQEADIVVGHNGDKFDMKKLNTRRIYHKLPPIVS